MKPLRNVTARHTYICKVPHGADLLQTLTEFCVAHGIMLGRVEAIGAVQKARIAFYDQSARKYEHMELARPLEIVKLAGNISVKDDRPFVHAHVALADRDGRVYGGHLAEGNIVFACECIIEAYTAAPLERAFDETTGLGLWKDDIK